MRGWHFRALVGFTLLAVCGGCCCPRPKSEGANDLNAKLENFLARTPSGLNGLEAELQNAVAREGDVVELDFVLRNTSDQPIVLAERWNSWGAYQWSFIVKDAKGKDFLLWNPQEDWELNFLSFFTIPPRSQSVMKCRLDKDGKNFDDDSVKIFTARDEGLYGPPLSTGRWTYPISITGIFSVEKYYTGFDSARTKSNWMGDIKTKPMVVRR